MPSHTSHAGAMRRTLGMLGAAVLAVGLTAVTGYPANAAPTASDRSTIPGSSPGWTSTAQVAGTPAAGQTISFRVALKLRDQAGAERLAGAVSDPKNPSYGKYLTPAQFNVRYAPTAAQVRAVENFLSGQGIAVSGVAAGNRWIDASGTIAQVQQAFAAAVKTYDYHGKRLRGTPSALSAPSGIARLIAGVIGVSQSASLAQPDHVAPVGSPAAAGRARLQAAPNDALPPPSACSTYYNQHTQTTPPAYGQTSFPTIGCGYTPAELRRAYGISAVVSHHQDGSGVTVAIIDAYASPTIVADVNQLSAANGEPLLGPGQYTETTFPPFNLQDECGGEAGWNIEESIDVESVHAMAPGANIHYVGAQNCDTGIDDAMNYVLQNHLADIVSNSYGFTGEDGLGGEVAVEHSMFVQAAIEGIGLYYSSGDAGDNVQIYGTPHPEPDFPASDPLVTGVGGTTLEVRKSGAYAFETAWGNVLDQVNTETSPSSWTQPLPGTFLSGSGGGVSALFAEPLYQRLAVPRSLATLNGSAPMRVVPDVAAVADPETGFRIIYAGTAYQYGGTSLAAPVFAGFQAVASQYRRSPIGFANPLLYVLGLSRVTFHDITASAPTKALVTPSGRSLLTIGQDTSLTATRGYDDTTGLGTPRGIPLLLGESLG